MSVAATPPHSLCISFLTELMWELMSTVQPSTTNDQLRLNLALAAMGIYWEDKSIDIAWQPWHGRNSKGDFLVTLLPQITVCRAGACSRHRVARYYIWHKGGSHSIEGKQKDAKAFWYLRGDWESLSATLDSLGHQWLQDIATH